MSGSGTLTLTQATNGYPVHLFDGAITINSGTLVAADLYFGLNFTSSITVNGGTLNVQTAPSEQGNLYLNGGTVTSTGLADVTYGNILLSQNSTAVHAGGAAVSTISVNQVNLWGVNSIDVGAGSTLNITSVVAEYGPAGLNKTGAGTLALSGANTYSGNTTVTGGTLSLGLVNSNNESSTVSITASAGAILDLAFVGTDTVDKLYINGVQQPIGDYTVAHASGAFTGGGTLHVTSDPAGYASWKAVNAPTGTPGEDYDGDGVSNGSEFVLGGTKDTSDLSKLPAISTSGANMVFTFQRAQASIDGTTAVAIQVGSELNTWSDSYNVPGTAQANNPGVTVVKDTSLGFDTVTLTVPRAPDAKKFARLVVTPAP
jgi:autotransporter-associated beta strand protein